MNRPVSNIRQPFRLLLATAALLPGLPVHAATTDSPVAARQDFVENGCNVALPAFAGQDCSYNDSSPTDLPTTWLGPTLEAGYYVSGQSPCAVRKGGVLNSNNWPASCTETQSDTTVVPNTGNDIRRVDLTSAVAPLQQLALGGTFTIDDNDTTADGTDDLISFVITLAGAVRNVALSPTSRAEESFSGITHTLAPTIPDAATPNAFGGFDYVIGVEGFPAPLAPDGFMNHMPFPSATPSKSAGSVVGWSGPGAHGIASYECPGGSPATNPPSRTGCNVGASTTAVVTGYSCITDETDGVTQDNDSCGISPALLGSRIDQATGGSCDPAVAPGGEFGCGSFGFENLVAEFATDDTGRILTGRLYGVHETGLQPGVAQAPNTMTAVLWEFQGPSMANDDEVDALAPLAIDIDVLENDVGFIDPVTVTIIDPPDIVGATATVNGSPGDQASVNITYTPAANSFGVQDFFEYEVGNGITGDTAIVTVNLEANLLPVALDQIFTISTVAKDPSTVSDSFDALNVTGNEPGNLPAIVTVQGGTSGSFAVNGPIVSYTPDADFYAGADSGTYTITDRNGDQATGDIDVTIPDATPGLANLPNNTTEPGESTTIDVVPAITLGNGSFDVHTLIVNAQASDGTCSLVDFTVVYEPEFGFAGEDACELELADGDGDTDTGVVTIIVSLGVPVTNNDVANTEPGQPVNIDVLANDTGLTDPPLWVTATDPINGTAIVETDNTITYTPDGGFSGTDAFVYTVTDASGDQDAATVAVIVQPDTDGDGTPDPFDNCTLRPNGLTVPDAGGNVQLDTDGDGFGNMCDGDLNNDQLVNSLDLGLFKTAFLTSDPDADLNGDGIVNSLDLGLFKQAFLQPPGPAGNL